MTLIESIRETNGDVVPPEPNRLAAIVGQAFSTMSRDTRDAARYTIYSEVAGKPIHSGKELDSKFVSAMLSRWAQGWTLNETGKKEIAQIFKEWGERIGQGRF